MTYHNTASYNFGDDLSTTSSLGSATLDTSMNFDNDNMWMFNELLTTPLDENNSMFFPDSNSSMPMEDVNHSMSNTSMPADDATSSLATIELSSNAQRPRFDSVTQPSQRVTEIPNDTNIEPLLHDSNISCMAIALQIVAELHVSNGGCFSSVSSLFSPSAVGETRDINTVLDYNRQALWKAIRVLDCPCAKETGVVGAVCMAVHKVLSWYAAAIGVDGPPAGENVQVPVESVTNPPIYMGSYCLDAQAQKLARAHVVLSELREHVHPLLARLDRGQLASEPSAPSLASGDSSCGSLPSPLSSTPDADVVECYRRGLWDEFNALTAKADNTRRG